MNIDTYNVHGYMGINYPMNYSVEYKTNIFNNKSFGK